MGATILCAMRTAKRIRTCLIRINAEDSTRLCGQIQLLGDPQAIPFANARELVLALRVLMRNPSPDKAAVDAAENADYQE